MSVCVRVIRSLEGPGLRGCVQPALLSAAGMRDVVPPARRTSADGEKPLARESHFGFLNTKCRSSCCALGQGALVVAFVAQAEGVKAEPFENHSALEIAEQLTLLDHLVFKKIPYE